MEPKVLSQHRAAGFPWDSRVYLIIYIWVRANQFFYRWGSAPIQAKPEFTSESNTEKLTGSTSQTDQAGADSHQLHVENICGTPASLHPAHGSQFLIQPCFSIWNIFLEINLYACLVFSCCSLAKILLCSNRAHFSWLCRRAPPSRTVFFPSFYILQVLYKLPPPFTGHHLIHLPLLCISPEVMETSCPKYFFLNLQSQISPIAPVATWGSNTVLYPSYVGKLCCLSST